MCFSSNMRDRRNSIEIGNSGVRRLNNNTYRNNSSTSRNSQNVFKTTFNKIPDIQLRQRPLIISFRKYDCVDYNNLSVHHSSANNLKNNVYLRVFERPNTLENSHSNSLPTDIFVQRSEIREMTDEIPLRSMKKSSSHNRCSVYHGLSTFYSE